jgi:hypothetical protein
MSKQDYLRKRPFLVIIYHAKPAPSENTSVRGWGEKAKWEANETANFVDRVSNKMLVEASVIIDIMNAKVVKNRYDRSADQQVMEHYISKYKDKVKEAVAYWMQTRKDVELSEATARMIAPQEVAVNQDGQVEIKTEAAQ